MRRLRRPGSQGQQMGSKSARSTGGRVGRRRGGAVVSWSRPFSGRSARTVALMRSVVQRDALQLGSRSVQRRSEQLGEPLSVDGSHPRFAAPGAGKGCRLPCRLFNVAVCRSQSCTVGGVRRVGLAVDGRINALCGCRIRARHRQTIVRAQYSARYRLAHNAEGESKESPSFHETFGRFRT